PGCEQPDTSYSIRPHQATGHGLEQALLLSLWRTERSRSRRARLEPKRLVRIVRPSRDVARHHRQAQRLCTKTCRQSNSERTNGKKLFGPDGHVFQTVLRLCTKRG